MFFRIIFEKHIDGLLTCLYIDFAMTKQKFKTGVRKLSAKKLRPIMDEYRINNAMTWHQVYVATAAVPGGASIAGSRLQELVKDDGLGISDDAKFSLCTVLGVTWEEISEPLD